MASCPSVCAQVINHLLSPSARLLADKGGEERVAKKTGYKQPPVRIKSSQLSLANRWLVAVLVSHANKLGAVRELGMAALRQLTGMSEPRLKAQLLRLVELGVIRSYAPGISSLLFTGVKVSRSYFLNLAHPLLGLEGGGAGVVVIDAPAAERREAVTYTAEHFVKNYFQQLSDVAFDVFCHRLDGYTSFLLSTYWEELGRSMRPDLEETLQVLVDSDFQRPEGKSADGLNIDEGRWLRVIEHFCWLAFERARSIRKELTPLLEGKAGGAQIQLVPTPSAQVTTLFMEAPPVPLYGCLVIKYHPWKVCEPYKDEAELALEDRYRFGLQARSKG